MTRRAVIAITAAVAVAVPGAALAASKNDRPAAKCRVISVTESQPAYMGPWDETGTVTVTTKARCRGEVKTSTTTKIVTREVAGSNGAPVVGTR